MSTPFTLEPLGAVGELERRATIPIAPPLTSEATAHARRAGQQPRSKAGNESK